MGSALWTLVIALFTVAVTASATKLSTIKANDPLIWYHGRWDSSRGSWWPGTGFTLYVENLSSLSLYLGPNTTSPTVNAGLSVNYEDFTTIVLKNGTNVIPLGLNSTSGYHSTKSHSVIRIHSRDSAGNNIYLEKIAINSDARLLPYTPSKLNFQFIGDSLSSGYLLPNVISGSWPMTVTEAFKAEQQINALPGACLTDKSCWGNPHGISFIFFKTEDTNYYYNPNHNYTTDWNFHKDHSPTHVFFQAGTNDYSYQTSPEDISAAYLSFLDKLRRTYPTQPIFVLGTWGWPNEDGTYGYFYEGIFEDAVAQRNALGDKKVYFINTRGWIAFDDVYEDRTHPNPQGSAKIAANLQTWLKNWGLQPQKKWPTIAN